MEPRYSEPLKCGHLVLTDVLLWYGLHSITAIHHNPWNADTPLFHKADRFFGPFATWTVHNSLDNADAHLPLTQGCPPRLINSTTGHYSSTGMYSTQPFSQAYSKGEPIERAFVVLNSTDASIIWTRSGGPMTSAIEGFNFKNQNRQMPHHHGISLSKHRVWRT